MGKQYVLADQMYASNFDASSFISHQYIISAPGRICGQLPGRRLGLPRRFRRPDQHGDPAAQDPGLRRSSAGIQRRSATSSIKPASRGASTPPPSTATATSGAPIRPSNISTTATTGRTTSSRRRRSSSATSRTASCAPSAGSRRRAGTPITRAADRTRAPRGSRRWSTRSANRNTGTRPRSSSSGMTTAAGSIPSRRRIADYDGLGIAHPDADRLALREEGLGLAHPLRARQHPAVHRGSLRAGSARGERHARDAPERRLRLQQAAAAVQGDSGDV